MTVQEDKYVEAILSKAIAEINAATGLKVTALLPMYSKELPTPKQVLQIAAGALDCVIGQLKDNNKERRFVEVRWICMYILRSFFGEKISHADIARLFNQDQSTACYGIAQATELLRQEQPDFTYKYNKAITALNEWLQQ